MPLSGASPQVRAGGLHRALQLLRRGDTVFIMADEPVGAEAFRIPLPGGPLVVRSGWLALRRCSGTATFPVLSHLDGRHHRVTIHPALPPPEPEPDADVVRCWEKLTPLIEGYVRRFPEQCRSLALWS